MIPIYRPDNPADLALAESLLIAEGIPYFVHNNHFGGLYPGAQIDLYNNRTLMVSEADLFRASEVLEGLTTVPEPLRPSPKQTFRMLFEMIVFGWFFPSRRKKDTSNTSDDSLNHSRHTQGD